MTQQAAQSTTPPIGWTTPARVVDVYDGDTIEVDIVRRVRVRLLDCWAPEVRTKNTHEKQAGIRARDHLRAILPVGSEIVLHIPTQAGDAPAASTVDVQDVFTFGRVLGRVFDKNGQDVSAAMVAAGHATAAKE